jgi:hypothetical protein
MCGHDGFDEAGGALMAGYTWSTHGTELAAKHLNEMAHKTQNGKPAWKKMLQEVILPEQRRWWSSEGRGSWAPRKDTYARWMAERYPSRILMRGPDRKNHKGLQLRNALTRYPFQAQKLNPKSFEYGTDLPYAELHQKGNPAKNLPMRMVVAPIRPKDLDKMTEILKDHITNERGR